MIEPVSSPRQPAENASAQPLKKNDIAGAARQFESLLLTQILRTVREAGSSGGWLGSGEDAASSTSMEMAEEQFAAALSAQGGFGLARMVTDNLHPNAGPGPAAAPVKPRT
jgi:Rod binding domain-containing protein